ncbi:MAG: hypothetical protein KDA73_08020 [Rhodobacteraceae bacterium]|nr:hypothetical protein [Paracoccaceae bacterium]
MIELLFVSCLAASPLDCERRSLLYVDIPVMTCLLQAQSVLAQWIDTHPGARIERWACRTVDRRSADL